MKAKGEGEEWNFDIQFILSQRLRGTEFHPLTPLCASLPSCLCVRKQSENSIGLYKFELRVQVREDEKRIGALKSETIKSGSPDWSENKTFSLFSW